jgi:hypothetical protein
MTVKTDSLGLELVTDSLIKYSKPSMLFAFLLLIKVFNLALVQVSIFIKVLINI